MAKRIREKAIARKQNADKRPTATVTNIGVSSTKVKLVLDLVRGKNAEVAATMLENMRNGSALAVKKVIESAMANAEHNMGLNRSDLYVAEIYCTQGPTMKRMSVRARGRADVILKRSSNVTVILDQVKA